MNSERDWPEDYPHENGNYRNVCVRCNEVFHGHKRRYACKSCVGVKSEREKLKELLLEGWTIVRGEDHVSFSGETLVRKTNEFWTYEFGGRTTVNGHFTIDLAYTHQFKMK